VAGNERNMPDESKLGVPERLAEYMKALLEPGLSVPPEIDRAVLDRANRHFTGREFTKAGRRSFRWVALWKVAAAAAVVIFALSLNLTHESGRTIDHPVMTNSAAVDFDRNGTVDILDAFKLARRMELAGTTEANLDINGDGMVNRDDVDMVAFAAVSLTPAKQGAGKGVL